MAQPKVIFFGNGMLADAVLKILQPKCNIIFHARTKEDLATVKEIKVKNPDAHGILASFGVMIKEDVLELFEPEGIINVHPSKLPDLRGPSPIESAMLRGDKQFFVSIMKLVKAMDAGPLYCQLCSETALLDPSVATPEDKPTIYENLATLGANWIVENLDQLPSPVIQNEEGVTFCQKLDKSMSMLTPETKTAVELLREISAFAGFPKSKYVFSGHECIIHAAHILNSDKSTTSLKNEDSLPIKCFDDSILYVDYLQPAGKKMMDAKSFKNGYMKDR